MSYSTPRDENSYFIWQDRFGQLAAEVSLFKFQPFIGADFRVIDFGCGGGHLLGRLACRDKLGVEPSPSAIEAAQRLGVPIVSDLREVPDGWADVVVSHHALEHVEEPLWTLRHLRAKLRKGGHAIFVVPSERWRKYEPKDRDQHLFTWTAMNLGNLFERAGYSVEEVRETLHIWPPKPLLVRRYCGLRVFQMLSFLRGRFDLRRGELRIVAAVE